MNHVNFIDVGACVGNTVYIATKILEQAKIDYTIYAVEPCKENIKQLEILSNKNSRIKIIEAAISEESIVKLYHAQIGNQGHSIFSSKSNVVVDKFEEVKGISILDVIKDIPNFDSSINILKINIEGAELILLKDLYNSKLLSKFSVLLYHGDLGYPSDLDKIDMKKEDKEFAASIILEFKKNGGLIGSFTGWEQDERFDLVGYVNQIIKKDNR